MAQRRSILVYCCMLLGLCLLACAPTDPCNNITCRDDETCKAGKCEPKNSCSNGQTDCNGSCVDTQTDKTNCGTCGNTCQNDDMCKAGKCEATNTCPNGQTDCNGSCVDTQTNKNHCGTCSNACPSDEVCKAGKCEAINTNCPTGQTKCNGSCVDTQTDKANCGACDTSCLSAQSCKSGNCECPTNQTECAKACVDTKTNNTHCGACNNTCTTSQVCQNGQCQCPTGQTNCNGTCADTQTDKANCGTCGKTCKLDELCYSAKCIKLQPYLYAAQRSNNSSVGIHAVIVDGGGNAFVTGTFAGEITFDTNTIQGKRSFDVFVAKLDTQGKVAWATRIGQDGSDIGYGVALDSQGNLYVAGHEPFGKYAKDTNRDILLVKLDPTGKQLFRKVPGSTSTDIAYGVAVDAQDHMWLTGIVGSPGNFDTIKLQASGSQAFVAKATSKGQWIWVKGLGSVGSISRSVAVDKAGNGYITGSFSGQLTVGSTTLNSKGKSDIFVIKYAPNGNALWAVSGGGTEDDQGRSIAVDGVGNVYIAGTIKNSATLGTETLTSKGNNDLFVAKISTRGQWQWAKSTGNTGNDSATSVAIDPAGNAYVTGAFETTINFGTNSLTATKSTDIFLAKIDASGQWLSAQSGGGDGTDIKGDDLSGGVACDPNGNAYVVGTVRSAISFQGLSVPKASRDQVFVSRVMANTCATSCPSGSTCCNGSCRQLATDANNCGACAAACPLNGNCTANTCSCPSGETNCGLTCTNTQSDFHHCGTCGTVCPKGGSCQSGTCICPSGQTVCGNTCVDTKNDRNHCGACGKICGTGQLCQGSTCVCPPGQDYCGNACTDVRESTTHCGKCGNKCPSGNICVDQVCKASFWAKGASGAISTNSVKTDSTGNVYSAGGFASTARFSTKSAKSKGSTDIFVAKYDNTGTIKELVSFGGTSTDTANDISVSANGTTYITGVFRDTVVFGTTTLSSKGREDLFVAKFDKDLKLIKVVSFGTTRDEQGTRIAQDASGNVYLVANLESSETLTLGSQTLKGPTVAFIKMDKDLKVIKATQAKGISRPSATGLFIDTTGDVYATFNFSVSSTGSANVSIDGGTSVTVKGSKSSNLKGVLVRLDKDLKPLKIASATDNNLDELNGVVADGKGNVYVAGSSQQNAAIAKLNKDLVWGKTVATQGSGFDTSSAIAIDSQSNIYVTCNIRSAALNFGNTTLTGKGGDDILLLKLDKDLDPLRIVRGLGSGTDTANDIWVSGSDFYVVGYYATSFTVKGVRLSGTGAYVTKNLP